MQTIWSVSLKKIKVLLHKHNFSPVMHGWEFSPIIKDVANTKEICVKLI